MREKFKYNNYIWKWINNISKIINKNISNVENSIKNWIFSILIWLSLQANIPNNLEWNTNFYKKDEINKENIIKAKNYYEIIDANINWKDVYRIVNWKKEAYWISPNDTIFFNGETKIINWTKYYKIKLLNDRNITWYVRSNAFYKSNFINSLENKEENIQEVKNENIEEKKVLTNYKNNYKIPVEWEDLSNFQIANNENETKNIFVENKTENIKEDNKIEGIAEEKNIEKSKIEILAEENKKQIEKIIEENRITTSENNETERRMNYIKDKLYDDSFNENLNAVINTLQWEEINFKWKKIVFSNENIEKNKDIIKNNLITFLLLMIEIESDWDTKKKNPRSSAEWLWQWLTKNWKYETVYFDWKKWTAEKEESKNYINEKTVYLTSSIETILQNIKEEYQNQNEILEDLNFIPKNFKKQNNIKITNIWLDKQLKLLCLSLSAYNTNKKIWKKIVSSDKLVTKILLWDIDAIRVFYDYFHHTKPDKATIARVDEILPKYMGKIIQVQDV